MHHPTKPKLLEQVRQRIRTKHYSLSTEKTYVQWVKQFILFHNKRHPKEMGNKEINAFLTYPVVKRRVASSTPNQALCAIIFLYKQVLKIETGELEITWIKKGKRLPVVFSINEVKKIMEQLSGTKWIMAIALWRSMCAGIGRKNRLECF